MASARNRHQSSGSPSLAKGLASAVSGLFADRSSGRRAAPGRTPPAPPRPAGRQTVPPVLGARLERDMLCRAMLSARVKLTLVGCVFLGLWGLLWLRAAQLQIVQADQLAKKAAGQHLTSLEVAGPRGHIFDRHGLVLAKSVEFTSVYCRPLQVDDPARASVILAKALQMPRQDALAKLTAKEPFVWIQRQASDKAATAIREANMTGVYLTPEYGRQYPSTFLAGQLLGFVGLDDKGLSGVEQALDQHLRGRMVKVRYQRDAAGRALSTGEAEDLMEANKGGDVTLTLDATVQMHAQEILSRTVTESKARWAGAIVVDVPTAEVLAWAEYPFFNPNAYREASSKERRSGMAIDALEMGSSIKPLVVAAALQENIVSKESKLFCENGAWHYAGKTIKDTHSYAELTVPQVVRYSSNICTAKLGLELGKRKLHDYFHRLGFGQKVGLGLPGEGAGLLRPPGAWYDIDLATASFGQGFATTIPQLAKAYLCLAFDGVMRPLKLFRTPAPKEESAGVRVFDPRVAWDVLSMMQEVVELDGTGRKARIEGVHVAGKTGTAQKAKPTGGYGGDYVAVFVGVLPVEDPRYLIAVVVDEPQTSHYGGLISAPAFREIAINTMASMGTLPDAPVAATDGEAATAGGAVRLPVSRPQPPASLPTAPVLPAVDQVLAVEGSMPDLQGISLRKSMEWFAQFGIVPEVKGQGVVIRQQHPPAGAPWDPRRDKSQRYVLWLGAAADNS